MSLSSDMQNLNLDVNNIGSWPVWVRGLAIALVCIAVLVIGYMVIIKPELDRLSVAESKELSLKSEFELKQSKAANLEQYQEQMGEIERSFGTLLRQLPSKTEVADLLSEISSIGAANGLEFKLFQPEKEQPLEFYAELPIQLELVGEYHQFGRFVSDVARLPRIVTLHDFKIGSTKEDGFSMTAQAKTYRYLDDEEIAQANKAKKNAGKRTARKR
ncbi:Type IV pilus biogenesis protein PilO [hydrothermal vent metagenome]|uniref:Type IV pilus biogenesis protein PilO n=1 Tax=hydrothermal vent metagenome TaxID=652676 RepID=A0A3B0ZHC0_9ZZZZ